MAFRAVCEAEAMSVKTIQSQDGTAVSILAFSRRAPRLAANNGATAIPLRPEML